MGVKVDNHRQIIAEHSSSLQPGGFEGKIHSKKESYGEYEGVEDFLSLSAAVVSRR